MIRDQLIFVPLSNLLRTRSASSRTTSLASDTARSCRIVAARLPCITMLTSPISFSWQSLVYVVDPKRQWEVGDVLEQVWDYLVTAFGQLWDSFGTVVEQFCNKFGTVLIHINDSVEEWGEGVGWIYQEVLRYIYIYIYISVSYKHLTLTTIILVYISVVAV